jgi:putative transposase
MIRWYRHHWGIENGFKKLKHFMVQTTLTKRDYRFFNFVFACVYITSSDSLICW